MKNQNGEERIDAAQVLSEIIPLMKDYFVGDVSFDGNRIVYILNGQKFLILAGTI